METVRVLVACTAYPPYTKGDGEISTQNLVEALARAGTEVSVVTIADRPCQDEVNGINVIRLAPPNTYWSASARHHSQPRKLLWHLIEGYNVTVAYRLREVIREVRPDVFHTSTVEDLSPYAWKVAHSEGVPVVHTLRSYTVMCPRGTMFHEGRNCDVQCLPCQVLSVPKRLLSHYVSLVVGSSRSILTQHLAAGFFPRADTDVIFNICEPQSPDLPPEGTNGPLRFGFLGPLHPIKGVELLIREFAEVREEYTATLAIAGTGSPDYERSLRSLDVHASVQFLGHQQPTALLRQIDVLVVPSLCREALPGVIFEAYAHGVPVIASYLGANPEIVNPGVTGFFFDPSVEGALAAAMRRIIRQPDVVSQMRQACVRYSRQVSASVISSSYRGVYQRALVRARAYQNAWGA